MIHPSEEKVLDLASGHDHDVSGSSGSVLNESSFRVDTPSMSGNSFRSHGSGAKYTSVHSFFEWSDSITGHRYEPRRMLHTRHLMMIAIGGTIGTGIFLSAGTTIAIAGPGGALLGYFIVGLFVYTVVIALGEMSAMYPVSGAFSAFGTRFVSPAFGFTLGWNYWFQWTLSIPSQLSAAGVILSFWTPHLQLWHWAIIIVVPVFALQFINVRAYGESEYWLSMIKVLMVIVFIMIGLICDWGGIKGHPGSGLSNFRNSDAFIGGFFGFSQTFLYAFFSFGGIELIAVTAGEAVNPQKAVPRAIKATFFRILIFYLLTVLTIGLSINAHDPSIAADPGLDVTASPLTVVFQRAGFNAAAHLINAVLLTAIISATNSCFYASSRTLLALARAGQAPRIFGCVNRKGVPIPALLLAFAVTFVTFFATIWDKGIVFNWMLNLTGISALLVWGSIGVISIRFRMAYRAQNRDLADLPFRQPFYPLLPISILVLATLMFLVEGYVVIATTPFQFTRFLGTYIGVLVFAGLYIGHICYERLFLKERQHFVPLLQVDLDSDVFGCGISEYTETQNQSSGSTMLSTLRSAVRRVTKHIY